MRTFIFILFCILCGAISIPCHSQDIIVKKDRTEIKAVVVEVTDANIKYKEYGVEGGSVISIKKADVFMTIYSNGYHEYYDDSGKATDSASAKKKKGFLGIFKKKGS
jgi:hypothetical protein